MKSLIAALAAAVGLGAPTLHAQTWSPQKNVEIVAGSAPELRTSAFHAAAAFASAQTETCTGIRTDSLDAALATSMPDAAADLRRFSFGAIAAFSR